MGKRYFCDYCDRSFQDNLHNRKKHLNGVQHLRARKVWYDLFRDAAAMLQEEQTKKPCRKFLQTGQCDFGSNCRFSHMTEKDLEKLSSQVQEERRATEQPSDGAVMVPGTIEDWLEKRSKRIGTTQPDSTLSEEESLFQYPPGWPPIQDLPPSLQAPPPGGWLVPPNLQWG
ncbi:zinc finger matrin-type protein 5 [Hemicordylus capensis]|uniref:zinc finger matrin-type protein 5 n=1 Tax=Hemicordylus capensis TaxID=884348 RepID=UPI00230299A2|nr:zinc finger matrin-type protein 5 [Hemicordylus capensis]XP_053136056.1 zinc finger matrin-type protein 5 [Hemicordylus capensis]